MGTELNNAIKFLVSPREPETLTFEEIRVKFIQHFDLAKNKYVESIKFRRITQQENETIAHFALRLKQS